ncbi:hypothetical protein AB0B25_08055 [Nocardia sp. NPDC049190]|uniref:hypothetical protein n=1 Tax=Nocardia sp. NPDC049190 TaxID=3155650 RepID=UPI0033E0060A
MAYVGAEPDINSEHGSGWLHPAQPVALQPVPPVTDDADLDGGIGWQWITPQPPPSTTRSGRSQVPRRVWVGLTAGLVVAAVLIGAGINSATDRPDTAMPIPTLTAGPPTPPSGGACAGLSGHTVTYAAGDTHSMAGVIAAFEHAYYVQRSSEAAMQLVAPEAGLSSEAVSAGIASIPTGTTHCVGITPIAEGAAEVHLVERHPDGLRIDYLQLINIRQDPSNTVITNIQKQG